MDLQQIEFNLNHSVSIKLMQSQNAPLIIGFLYQQFKQTPRLTIGYNELGERLERYLDNLNEQMPGVYTRAALDYLKDWCDDNHRFLRNYMRGNSDEWLVELTPETEKALSWVEQLEQRNFIGTESRFLQIFGQLEDIAARSGEDVEARLAQLERQKEAIELEIDQIRATGKVKNYTPVQLKERFLQTNEMARQLLRDFGEVEQNFRRIARIVQEAQLKPGARKGEVVGTVLDADEQLKNSEEGRSFYAFWEFLVSPSKQEELQALLDAVYKVPELQDLVHNAVVLRQININLYDAGDRVVQSNQGLAKQLRQMLDERNLAESRRIRELIGEVKQVAFRLTDNPPDNPALMVLEGPPQIRLPMERELWEPSEAVTFNSLPWQDEAAQPDEADLFKLYNSFYVDEARLLQRIDTLLEIQSQVGLGEVLEKYPPEKGLAEVLAYFSIAAHEERHTIDAAQREQLTLPDVSGRLRTLQVPQILFRRIGYAQ